MKGGSMHSFPPMTLSFLGLLLAAANSSVSQERDRSKIPEQYQWNLADIYPTDDAWKKAKEQLIAEISNIEQYRGTLGQSPEKLLGCVDLVNRLAKEYARLSSYARMHSDQ